MGKKCAYFSHKSDIKFFFKNILLTFLYKLGSLNDFFKKKIKIWQSPYQ